MTSTLKSLAILLKSLGNPGYTITKIHLRWPNPNRKKIVFNLGAIKLAYLIIKCKMKNPNYSFYCFDVRYTFRLNYNSVEPW